MNDQLRTRLGAVILALVSLTAVIFAVLNFEQRSRFVSPSDGATWIESERGVVALHVVPGGPAERAGLHEGDRVEAVNGRPIYRPTDVTRVVWHAGPWAEVHYRIVRNDETLDVSLITAPEENPSSLEGYLRITALLYLFIGLFIFVRRWNAPRAVHFYVFCLVSFILYSFHYTGKLNSFDWTIYWGNVIALLLQPALLVHFALVFPERRGLLWPKLGAVYSVPIALLALHVFVATGTLDFVPSLASQRLLDQLEYFTLGIYFLLAAGIFLASYFRAPSGVLRQQLKWVSGGTLAGICPFLILYIVPFSLGARVPAWTKFSVFSLALIPLCYGYAVIRYRLMDVDIIFKRGLAYTFATAGVVVVYFGSVALIGELSHTAWPAGSLGAVGAIIVAAFLFQPLRDWVQARLDHFFYRDRLDYRRTLIQFGRTLANEVRIDPLLDSVLDRLSQTLLVDRLAVFLEDLANPGRYSLTRSIGLEPKAPLDLSFLDPSRPALAQGCLFIESARAAESESVRRSLEELDLSYFIPCRFHDHTPAILGLAKTVDGDYLSSDDLELLSTMAGYVAIAVENARLYQSLNKRLCRSND